MVGLQLLKEINQPPIDLYCRFDILNALQQKVSLYTK
jgi:hypothetical protein